MARLTYNQLEGVWIAGGGSPSMAPLMAAIAEAESGGDPASLNATDNGGTQSSFGLWQISTGTHAPPSPNWADPVTNARLAVGKLNSQGLGAWGTYTSGAYKAFLGGGSPTTVGIDITGVNTPAAGALAQSASNSLAPTCLIGIPSVNVASLVSIPDICFVTKKIARDLVGGALVFGGLAVALVSLAVIYRQQVGAQIPGVAAGVRLAGRVGSGAG